MNFYQFMEYPDDISSLGLAYYGPMLSEVEQIIDARERAAEEVRQEKHRLLEAKLRDAERERQEQMKQGKACPKCGFTHAWNGAVCGHCKFGT